MIRSPSALDSKSLVMPPSDSRVLDLQSLRRSCADCSLRLLCLPAGIAHGEFPQLEAVVRKPPPLKRGDPLFRVNDTFEHLYVVRSGSVKTVSPTYDGDTQIMGFHIPGEIVGLDAISSDRHQCDALALERTSVCAIPFTQLEQVSAQLPSLQRQLHRIISREIGHDHGHLAALGRQTARERLALFLFNLAHRLQNAGYSPTEFRLSMSREDIGNYLGLALATVSRLFSQLAEDGVVEIDRRQLRILQPQKLAQLAGQDHSDSGERSRGDAC